MKKIVVMVFIMSLGSTLKAQKIRSSQDSIKVFYDAMFLNLKKGYLLKDKVNWKLIESETEQNLRQYKNFANSLQEINPLFEKIGAAHCGVYYEEKKYAIPVNFQPQDFSEQWRKKYTTKPGFEAKVLDEKYGYILIPSMVFFDTSSSNINKISQQLYDQISELKSNNNLEGWIVDLRFNTGGNSWSMVLSLYDLLGDNDILTSLDADKKRMSNIKLLKGKYIENSRKQYTIRPVGSANDQVKVVIITGSVTASSGEIVAIAFKGRSNTHFIGEKTAGFTTGNTAVKLPFGAMMALTGSYNADRNGVPYERIIPEIQISKQDNFDDLLLDRNIEEAIKFITN